MCCSNIRLDNVRRVRTVACIIKANTIIIYDVGVVNYAINSGVTIYDIGVVNYATNSGVVFFSAKNIGLRRQRRIYDAVGLS